MPKKFCLGLMFILVMELVTSQSALAQPMIYPSAGQTPEQLNQDQATCESQATSQTGYHPSQPVAAPATTQPQAGGRLAGAARGAAVGGIVERNTEKDDRDIEDPSRSGARLGAVVGGSRQRQERRETRRQTQQQQATQAQQQQAFSQAFGSCMAARGYTIR